MASFLSVASDWGDRRRGVDRAGWRMDKVGGMMGGVRWGARGWGRRGGCWDVGAVLNLGGVFCGCFMGDWGFWLLCVSVAEYSEWNWS